MANRYVVATGGLESGIPVEKTHRFELTTQTWQQLPDMNVARSHHASCSLDGNVYVFCGQDRNQEPLNSIEVLEDTASNLDLIEAWKLIRVADTILFPRSSPGVAPLNRCIRVTAGTAEDLGIFADELPKALKAASA